MPLGTYESHSEFGSNLLPFICRNDTVTYKKAFFKPHWHENIEILHCIKGEGNVIINGTVFDFKPNTTIIVNPNQIHIISSESTVNYNCIIIFDAFLKENGINNDRYIFNTVVQNNQITKIYNKLYNSFIQSESPLKIRLNALELLCNLYENFSSEVLSLKDNSLLSIKNAIEYTNRNYQENITLDEIAKLSNLNKYYFTKKFKEITGKTYNEFLNNVRCSKARHMLKAGKSVNEVCFACGFNDPAYFSRVFKKNTGEAPSKILKNKI